MDPGHEPIHLPMYASLLVDALIFFVAAMRILMKPERSPKWELLLIVSLAGAVNEVLIRWVLRTLSDLPGNKLDQFIFNLDGLSGFQPSFALGRLLDDLPWLDWIANVTYDSLTAVALGLFIFILVRRSVVEARFVFLTFALEGICLVPFYLLFPVCGPRYAFSSFPFDAPAHLVAHSMTILGHPPNGVPSGHAAVALLIWWFLRRSRIGMFAGGSFAALSILAAVGSGEHYAFDIIVAVPYTMLIYAISAKFFAPRPEQSRKAETVGHTMHSQEDRILAR